MESTQRGRNTTSLNFTAFHTSPCSQLVFALAWQPKYVYASFNMPPMVAKIYCLKKLLLSSSFVCVCVCVFLQSIRSARNILVCNSERSISHLSKSKDFIMVCIN